MINTRHLVNSALAAACTVAALSAARARALEAERRAVMPSPVTTSPVVPSPVRAAAARQYPSPPVTVWSSTAAGACVASIMREPRLVSRDAAQAIAEVRHVRAA